MSDAETTYVRRSKLFRTHSVPELQEAYASLGAELADVVLHGMSDKAQKLMGVSRPLSTPPGQLWISPQSRLDQLDAGLDLMVTVSPSVECSKGFTHHTIMQIGSQIEQKLMFEQEANLRMAIRDAQQFEQFECAHRLQFAVNQEREKQLRERETERRDLLAMFQEERDQMIRMHADAEHNIRKNDKQWCRKEIARQLDEQRKLVEKQCAEQECRWKVEEAILRTFLADAQERQNEAVRASKNEYFRIFKKLYNHFVTELNEQSDDMYCKHLAELMHVISVEKMLAFTMRDALKSELAEAVEQAQRMNAQIQQQKDEFDAAAAKPSECPNLRKWKIVFASLLKQYGDFVEWSVGEKGGQARYLLPIQKLVQSIENEKEHAESAARVDRECATVQFLKPERIPDPCTTPIPFCIGTCDIKSEPSTPETISVKSSSSSSLGCFDYQGKTFASNKHYNEMVRYLYPDEPEPTVSWTEPTIEIKTDPNTYPTETEQLIQSEVTETTNKLMKMLASDTAGDEPSRSVAVHQVLSELVQSVVEKSPIIHQHAEASNDNFYTLLSTIDSMEMFGRTHRTGHEVSVFNNIDAETTETDADVILNGSSIVQIAVEAVEEKRSECDRQTSTAPFIELTDDEYMRSRQSVPPYMRPANTCHRSADRSIWQYRVTSDAEYQAILDTVAAQPDRDEKHANVSEQSTMTTGPLRTEHRHVNMLGVTEAGQRTTTTSLLVVRKPAKVCLRTHHRQPEGSWNGMSINAVLERIEKDAFVLDGPDRKSNTDE